MRKSFRKNNKGSLVDLFVLLVVLAAGGLFLVVGHHAMDNVIPAVQEQIGTNPAANETLTKANDMMVTFDIFILSVYVGLLVVLIMSAFLVNTHPAFFPIMIIALILAIIVAVPLSNAYQLIQAEAGVSGMTMTDFLMENLPLLTVVMGFIFVVVSLVKSRFSQ